MQRRDTGLRRRLLDAALGILENSSNPAALTIRAVADAVGVSQAAVYVHFASRDELAGETALEARTAHDGATRARIASDPDARSRIVSRLEANLDWALANPAVYLALGYAFDAGLHVVEFDSMRSIRDSGVSEVVDDIQQLLDTEGIAGLGAEELTKLQIAFEAGFTAIILEVPDLPWGPAGSFRRSYIAAQLRALGLTSERA